jgi:hypothetical protein
LRTHPTKSGGVLPDDSWKGFEMKKVSLSAVVPGVDRCSDSTTGTGLSTDAVAPDWPAALLEEIANHAMTVRGLLNDQQDGSPAILAAGHLVALIGALADRGLDMALLGMVCGGLDDWLMSPALRRGMGCTGGCGT